MRHKLRDQATLGIDDYKLVLLAILRAHSDTALTALRAIDRCLPEKARSLQIVVHLPQDAEGLFGVMVSSGWSGPVCLEQGDP